MSEHDCDETCAGCERCFVLTGETTCDRACACARQRRADYREMLRLDDVQKAENAQARNRCRRDAGLVAHLEAEAKRQGRRRVDWVEYFRNAGIGD